MEYQHSWFCKCKKDNLILIDIQYLKVGSKLKFFFSVIKKQVAQPCVDCTKIKKKKKKEVGILTKDFSRK